MTSDIWNKIFVGFKANRSGSNKLKPIKLFSRIGRMRILAEQNAVR